MKKLIIVLIFILFATSVFASKSFEKAGLRLSTDGLTNESLEYVKSVRWGINNSEKLSLFNTYKLDYVIPYLLNGLVGFGSGSLFIGDMTNGWTQLGLDVGSILFYIVGGALWTTGIYSNTYTHDARWIAGSAFIGLASLMFVANRIYQLITPYFYIKEVNGKFREALGYSDEASLEVSPFVNQAGVGLYASIKF